MKKEKKDKEECPLCRVSEDVIKVLKKDQNNDKKKSK